MRPATALLLVPVCVAVAFGAGWLFRSTQGGSPPSDDVPTEADSAPAGPGASEAGALLASARDSLEAAEEKRRKLEAERDRLQAEIGGREGGGEPEPVAGERPPKEPVFRYPAFEKALTRIDWVKSGEAVANMAPLMVEWAAEIAKGNESAPAVVAKVTRWNSVLISTAITAMSNGVPGTGINGQFSHPSVMANLVHATLAGAGQPLSPAQTKDLEAIGRRHIDDDARRLAGYTEATLALEKTIEEAALRDRFYAEVDRIVNDTQRDILHPESVRGRMQLDLFSSGIIWATLVRPVRYETRDDLTRRVTAAAAQHFALNESHAQALQEAVSEWNGALSDAYLQTPPTVLDNAGRLHVSRVRVAASATLAFRRALLSRLSADDPVAAKVRGESGVLLPRHRE